MKLNIGFLLLIVLLNPTSSYAGSGCDADPSNPLQGWGNSSPSDVLDFVCKAFPNDPLHVHYDVLVETCDSGEVTLMAAWNAQDPLGRPNTVMGRNKEIKLSLVSNQPQPIYENAEFFVTPLSASHVSLTRKSDRALLNCDRWDAEHGNW